MEFQGIHGIHGIHGIPNFWAVYLDGWTKPSEATPGRAGPGRLAASFLGGGLVIRPAGWQDNQLAIDGICGIPAD